MNAYINGQSRREFLCRSGATLTALCAAWGTREALADEKPYADLLKRLRTPNKQTELLLKPSYTKDAFDALAIDAPFLYRHEDRYYLLHIGFDGIGYRTGLASSDDLVHWKKEGLLIDRGPKGSVTEFNVALTWIVRDNALFGTGALKKVGGRHLGTYHAYPKPGYEAGPAVIGLCWSDDLKHWELDPPCLHASDPDAGAWERGGLYKSCLVEHEGVYYLFYNAKTADASWREQTGVATSKDLKTWQRLSGNPVLPNGPKGAFDDVFCSDPCVLRDGDTWVMFFYTLGSDAKARDSVAFSKDLLHWDKSGEILIDVGTPGSVDETYAHKPGIIAKDGTLYHFYCAVSRPKDRNIGAVQVGEIRGIGLATSAR